MTNAELLVIANNFYQALKAETANNMELSFILAVMNVLLNKDFANETKE